MLQQTEKWAILLLFLSFYSILQFITQFTQLEKDTLTAAGILKSKRYLTFFLKLQVPVFCAAYKVTSETSSSDTVSHH